MAHIDQAIESHGGLADELRVGSMNYLLYTLDGETAWGEIISRTLSTYLRLGGTSTFKAPWAVHKTCLPKMSYTYSKNPSIGSTSQI